MKYLIINADDFGYSKVFNEKILELLEKQFITSTSVMVEWIVDGQKEQIEELKNIRNSSEISVGLHIVFKNENFQKQIQEQFNKFVLIFGFKPDHIDIHKATFLEKGYPVIMEFCFNQKIPCKNHSIPGAKAIMTSEPIFGATKNNIDGIKNWLSNLKDEQTYAINFHPGIYDPESKSTLNKARETDARNIETIQPLLLKLNIIPISFKQLENYNS